MNKASKHAKTEAYEDAAKIAEDAWNAYDDRCNMKAHALAIAGNIRARAKEIK
jgi:hypothetical protein